MWQRASNLDIFNIIILYMSPDYSRRYYLMYKDRFKMNYLEKSRLEATRQKVPEDYYINIYKDLIRFGRVNNFVRCLAKI